MRGLDDEWDLDQSESLFHYRNSFVESQCCFDQFYNLSSLNCEEEDCPPNIISEQKHADAPQNIYISMNFTQKSPLDVFFVNQGPKAMVEKKGLKTKKRKSARPSPYHNFQKHLNSSIKQIIMVPQPSQTSPPYHHLANQLWQTFQLSKYNTKKILHFIFNQFNEYLIQKSELKRMGFQQIYQENTKEDLARAKNFLSQLAIQQLTLQNIQNYLQSRRIKKLQEFKKYLLRFVKELKDGFIKKRFTNRSKKQQIKLMIAHKQQQ